MPKRPNQRGNKGATGAGRGFSTISQAGGKKMYEDVPGWDARTHGNRRFGRGYTPPGGGPTYKKSHGVRYNKQGRAIPDMTMAGQGKKKVSRRAIKKRLRFS